MLVGRDWSGWTAGRRVWRLDWRAWRTVAASGLVALVLLAPTVFGGSPFGPTVDAATAREMPEFGPSGRNAFFFPDPYEYWIVSYRSGFDLRVTDLLVPGLPILYELLALAGLLPLAAACFGAWRPDGPSLAPATVLIAQVMLASLVLFLLAHLLLFRLYLPARFVAWTVPLALAIAAGVGIVAVLESAAMASAATGVAAHAAHRRGAAVAASGDRAGRSTRPRSTATSCSTGRPRSRRTCERSRLTRWWSACRWRPTRSQRSLDGPVLVNREYALAYHLGYYGQVERRARDVIEAYYAESPGVAGRS